MKRYLIGGVSICIVVLGAAICTWLHETDDALPPMTADSVDAVETHSDGTAAPAVATLRPSVDEELYPIDSTSLFDEIATYDDANGEVELVSHEQPVVEVTVTDQGSGPEKHLLRYHFEKGETVRWEVEHRAQVHTTVQGVTQSADTFSNSIKVWKVIEVTDDGRAKFVYSVERVDMRHHFEGKQDVHYNSLTDLVPPEGFEDVAKSVGIELSVMTLDQAGNVVEREERRPDKAGTAPPQEMITPPMPAVAVAVGAKWQIPSDIKITLQGGEVKKIAAQQKYTLEDLADGLATIKIETVVLTPVRDPAVEAQLVQSKANGVVRFDVAGGRVISQQSDVDERVVAFQGEGSAMHYVTRFVETLLPATAETARRPPAGPPAP
ncbi:MAG TPA: hypothetical protein VND64_33430 [Pirellulales bacterium]|nr:hypothetical protein [Pirellulales bacterium]